MKCFARAAVLWTNFTTFVKIANVRHCITDIFFDLDHTLWDFERNSALAFTAVFDKRRMGVDMETFLAHYVPINARYWSLYQSDQVTHDQLRYGRLRDTFTLMDIAHSDALLHELSEAYIEHLPVYNHLFDDARDTLLYLRPRYRLHIITNGFSQVQQRKIANSGLGEFFVSVTDSERAGAKKPQRGIFDFALQQAGVLPANSLMVGDSFEADVEGALNAGMKAVHYSPTIVPGAGHHSITRLAELKNLL